MHDLGLWYFPEFAPPGPAPVPVRVPVRTQEPEEHVDTHTVKGRQYRIESDGSWEIHKPGTGTLTKNITARDEDEIRTHGLDRQKYHLIKSCMVEDMTAPEASAYLTEAYGTGKKKRGYGQRTVDEYWAAIRRAAGLSPTKGNRGGARKRPQLRIVNS